MGKFVAFLHEKSPEKASGRMLMLLRAPELYPG